MDAQATDARLTRFSYVGLESQQGTLSGQGQAYLAAAGGAAPRLGFAGTLRLRDADVSGQCPRGPCPDADGRTFLADGNMTLTRFGEPPGRTDRLHADLAGTFTSAAFDETPAPDYSVGVGVAVGLAVIGLAWLLKPLLGLFARSARRPALENARRRDVFEAIQAHPGLSRSALQRHLGWPSGTLRFHLGRLMEDGLVVRQRLGNTARFFENHGRYSHTWRQVAPLRSDDARRLHAWLLEHPGASQADVSAETARWEWDRSKTRRRLQVLMDAGLVSCRAAGRRNLYTARQPPSPG